MPENASLFSHYYNGNDEYKKGSINFSFQGFLKPISKFFYIEKGQPAKRSIVGNWKHFFIKWKSKQINPKFKSLKVFALIEKIDGWEIN